MIPVRSLPEVPRLRRTAALAVTVLMWFALVSSAGAVGATLTVTTTRDGLAAHGGTCTLREAIAAVDSPGLRSDCGRAGRGSNTIVLGAGRYMLSMHPQRADGNSSGDLNVDSAAALTITGAGVRATVIDATGLGDRVLSVASGARLTLSHTSITGGRATAGPTGASGTPGAGCPAGGAGARGLDAGARGGGGGIFNGGRLVLDEVAVRGNRAGPGGDGGGAAGAGCNGGAGGQGGGGGGVYNGGKLTLIRSTVSGNDAGAGGDGGGGAANPLGTPGVGGGGGPGGNGGGIDNQGTLTASASTIASNRAGAGGGAGGGGPDDLGGTGGTGGTGGLGGGIFSAARQLTVIDSTLYGNAAGGGGAGGLTGTGGNGGSGGGIAVAAGAARVENATLAGNGVGTGGAPGSAGGNGSAIGSTGAAGEGGGLFVGPATGVGDLRLQNSIVASSRGANCAATTGSAIVNGGYDLSYGDETCPGRHGNPRLGTLMDNGGPTATMAIGSGGAATDRIPTRDRRCPGTDQRGVRRPQGSACDIGAYEFAIPQITFIAPLQGGSYERGSRVAAHFRCQEGGVASTIATCTGSVADGHSIATGRLGTVPFVITAIDKSGTRARVTIHYNVWVYVDPLREVSGLTPRRIDLGVDYAGTGPLLALGRARVTTASDTDSGPSSCWAISCWPGGGIVVLRLLDGPFAGKYMYVAEHITVSVRAGQTVNAGQQIATLHAGYPWSEWGWAAGRGPEALAMADGHWCHTCADVGDWSTIEGRNMNSLLMRLGAPSGLFQPIPSQQMPPGWPTWPR